MMTASGSYPSCKCGNAIDAIKPITIRNTIQIGSAQTAIDVVAGKWVNSEIGECVVIHGCEAIYCK